MIRFVLITIALIFGANIVSASNDISQFVFTTDSQTIKPNEISGELTIHYNSDEKTDATTTETIDLEFLSDSTSGEFLNKSGNPASEIMNKGTANRTFYYRDSTSGAYAITINMTGRDSGKHWMASQKITVLSNAEQSSSSSQNSSSSVSSVANSSGGSIIWPDEQQIYANAGKDKTGIVGADVLFEGKALGIKKEPLENAHYFWNFGDGSSGEGQNVKHIYKYPDKYIAVLEVSSGQYSTSDRVDVKISANELIVSEANNEFIKLKNKSGVILDISGWFLTGGGVLFKFPKSSFISAGAELNISSDISKIKFSGNDIKVDLLYSNGSVAFSYQNKKETKPQPIMPAVATAVVAVSSSSHTDKITQVIQSPKPTYDVGFATTTQLANVIYSSGENKDGKSYKEWLFLSVIIGLFSGGALFFVRHKSLS